MKTTGIIAEFNPFHNGHKYLIEEARRITNADFIAVVMSGSFTQRGLPGFMSKHERAKCALLSGADVVFELPFSYATSTAESFAYGGISILNSLNSINHVAFGSELGDINAFESIANRLITPDEAYKAALAEALSSGLSYPSARAIALGDNNILTKPNNILAVEYIKALKLLDSDIVPVTIKRKGNDYHDKSLSDFASAEAIRNAFTSSNNYSDAKDTIISSVPESCINIIDESLYKTAPVAIDDFSLLIKYALTTKTVEELASYQDMNIDLARRLLTNLNLFTSVSEFIKKNRTKEITYTRITRALLHALLNAPDMTRSPDNVLLPCPYTRILGFKKDAQALLHVITHNSNIPIVNKPADASKIMDENAYKYYELTYRADYIYNSVVFDKYHSMPKDDMMMSPIII